MTIPRLELTAAVTTVKLDQLILKHFELHIVDSKFWSDSEIVLAYINNETKRFNTFVANRVSQIRQVSEPCQWCHVPGKFNPADVISQGCQAGNLSNMWFEEPKFLWDYKANWPVSRTAGDVLSGDPEVKPRAAVHSGAVVTDDDVTSPRGLTMLMEHYSSYYQLRKAVCWLTRFLRHLQGQTISPGPITWPEMEVAEMQIIRFVQGQVYHKEIGDLKITGSVKVSSSLCKLSPKLAEGIVVVGGRLHEVPVSQRVKCPVILPHSHRLSCMIVQEVHGYAHLGID